MRLLTHLYVANLIIREIEESGGKLEIAPIKGDYQLGTLKEVATKEKGASGKDTTKKDASEKDKSEKGASEKDASEKDKSEKGVLGKDTAEKNVSGKDTTEKDASEKDKSEKGESGKDTTEKDASGKDTTEKDASKKKTSKKGASGKDTTEKDESKKNTSEKDVSGKDTKEEDESEEDTTEKDESEKGERVCGGKKCEALNPPLIFPFRAGTFTVPEKIKDAVVKNKEYFRAGAVGWDMFPDMMFSRLIVHPSDSGIWLELLYEKLLTIPPGEEFDRAYAFVLGVLTHYATDMFGNAYANEYAGGWSAGLAGKGESADKSDAAKTEGSGKKEGGAKGDSSDKSDSAAKSEDSGKKEGGGKDESADKSGSAAKGSGAAKTESSGKKETAGKVEDPAKNKTAAKTDSADKSEKKDKAESDPKKGSGLNRAETAQRHAAVEAYIDSKLTDKILPSSERIVRAPVDLLVSCFSDTESIKKKINKIDSRGYTAPYGFRRGGPLSEDAGKKRAEETLARYQDKTTLMYQLSRLRDMADSCLQYDLKGETKAAKTIHKADKAGELREWSEDIEIVIKNWVIAWQHYLQSLIEIKDKGVDKDKDKEKEDSKDGKDKGKGAEKKAEEPKDGQDKGKEAEKEKKTEDPKADTGKIKDAEKEKKAEDPKDSPDKGKEAEKEKKAEDPKDGKDKKEAEKGKKKGSSKDDQDEDDEDKDDDEKDEDKKDPKDGSGEGKEEEKEDLRLIECMDRWLKNSCLDSVLYIPEWFHSAAEANPQELDTRWFFEVPLFKEVKPATGKDLLKYITPKGYEGSEKTYNKRSPKLSDEEVKTLFKEKYKDAAAFYKRLDKDLKKFGKEKEYPYGKEGEFKAFSHCLSASKLCLIGSDNLNKYIGQGKPAASPTKTVEEFGDTKITTTTEEKVQTGRDKKRFKGPNVKKTVRKIKMRITTKSPGGGESGSYGQICLDIVKKDSKVWRVVLGAKFKNGNNDFEIVLKKPIPEGDIVRYEMSKTGAGFWEIDSAEAVNAETNKPLFSVKELLIGDDSRTAIERHPPAGEDKPEKIDAPQEIMSWMYSLDGADPTGLNPATNMPWEYEEYIIFYFIRTGLDEWAKYFDLGEMVEINYLPPYIKEKGRIFSVKDPAKEDGKAGKGKPSGNDEEMSKAMNKETKPEKPQAK